VADDWVAGEDSGIEVAVLGGRRAWSPPAGPTTASHAFSTSSGVSRTAARATCAGSSSSLPTARRWRSGHARGDDRDGARGGEGFGYDPIFVPLGQSRTVAELGNAWKADHSHRAKAARALAERLAAR
jgi:XTP/dITP diphosphohydrolase